MPLKIDKSENVFLPCLAQITAFLALSGRRDGVLWTITPSTIMAVREVFILILFSNIPCRLRIRGVWTEYFQGFTISDDVFIFCNQTSSRRVTSASRDTLSKWTTPYGKTRRKTAALKFQLQTSESIRWARLLHVFQPLICWICSPKWNIWPYTMFNMCLHSKSFFSFFSLQSYHSFHSTAYTRAQPKSLFEKSLIECLQCSGASTWNVLLCIYAVLFVYVN